MNFSYGYRPGHWSIAFASATFLALLLAGHSYLVQILAPETSDWGNQLFRTITGWYLWAAIFPLIIQLARNWRFALKEKIKSALVHLIAGATIAAFHAGAQVLITDWALYPDRDWNAVKPIIQNQLLAGLFWRFFIYQALLCCSLAFDAYQRAKKVQIAASRMEKNILHAQIESLKTQFDPAFFFQSLKQLSHLMRTDFDQAESLVARLGEYLRMRLDHSRSSSTTVPEQIVSMKSTLTESTEEVSHDTQDETSELQNPARKWAIILGIFTALAIYFTVQRVMIHANRGTSIDWPKHLLDYSGWYIWALITPFVLKVSAKYPLRKRGAFRCAIVHFFTFVASWAGATIAMESVKWIANLGDYSFMAALPVSFARSPIALDILCYSTIVAIENTLRYKRQLEFGTIRTARLSEQLTRARLEALKMQLHPHFLFNSLNSLSELMQEDPVAAEQMIRNLEMFLRLTVDQDHLQEIPFEKEIEFLQCYLAIENVRYQDKLDVSLHIEPETRPVPVPSLLLQPIVENAIRHGIAHRTTPGHIDIQAKRKNGILTLSVRDNGPGISKYKRDTGSFRNGVGLANTRERLAQLYGSDHRFELINAPEGGLIVNVEIPVAKKLLIQ